MRGCLIEGKRRLLLLGYLWSILYKYLTVLPTMKHIF